MSKKILCVLYDDPIDGYPGKYPRDTIPLIKNYPNGQSLPTPNAIDFTPGQLLGSISGELGLRSFLNNAGHEFIVTVDKDNPDSVFSQHLVDADVVISQPFWPAYLTAELIKSAKNLKLAITAGIGSDHIDLQAAREHDVTVAEVTYSNSNSVAEQNVMLILSLVRNYLPSAQWITKKGWNIADCVARSYDLEGMEIGVIGAGRIGLGTLSRLKPFAVNLHYTDQHRLPANIEKELGLKYHSDVESLAMQCDVLSVCCPLCKSTENLFDDLLLNQMKRGTYLINTARAKICNRDAIVRALENGQLAGYAGDVWFPQPATADHPWRTMPHHGMTPHIAGSTLSAQARYAAGVREILECWLTNKPIRSEYLIVDQGKFAGTGAHSYVKKKAEKVC